MPTRKPLTFYLPKDADPTLNEALDRIAAERGEVSDADLKLIVEASRADRERWLLKEAKREAKKDGDDDD